MSDCIWFSIKFYSLSNGGWRSLVIGYIYNIGMRLWLLVIGIFDLGGVNSRLNFIRLSIFLLF